MVKTLNIEARKKFDIKSIDFSILDKLPKTSKTISLAATIQYLDLIPHVKKYLESKNKKIIIQKGAFYDAHVIGCNSSAFDKNADALLLLTDGKFHALNNALQLNKEIYVFNTFTLEKVSFEDINKVKDKIKGKQNLFLNSNKIGLIVSTKPGQNFKNINKIKEKIKQKGKQVYLFETDNINMNEFENFPDIKLWVNTACYGLGLDDMRIINLQDVLEFL